MASMMKINSLPIGRSYNQDLKTGTDNQNINFQDVFKETIEKVNELQIEADQKSIDFALGGANAPDIHEIMISMGKASLALYLTIEIRNKLVESYQEIMRMQV